jgi:hypothetical protein
MAVLAEVSTITFDPQPGTTVVVEIVFDGQIKSELGAIVQEILSGVTGVVRVRVTEVK